MQCMNRAGHSDPEPIVNVHCAGLGNGSVCNLGIKCGVLILPYISQMLPKIPDAPLLGNYPDRRSGIFQSIPEHLKHYFEIMAGTIEWISI